MQASLAVKPVAVARPVQARSAMTARRPARSVVVRSGVEPQQIETAIKDAKDACEGGSTGECAAAWDTVEELSAAASHKKDAVKADPTISDPLEQYCAEDPSADECRVYED